MVGGGTKAEVQIAILGQLFRTKGKHLRLTVKQLIHDSLNGIRITQTIFAAAINTPDRGGGSLEGTAAGSWSVQVVEQSQAEAC